jgi:hypothetical protein
MTRETQRTITAAQGFFELGMWQAAWDELETIPPDERHLLEVIVLRLRLATAEAVHKVDGAKKANALLRKGESAHSAGSEYHYVLACLYAELGDIESAKDRLGRAFVIEPNLRPRAVEEPALKAVWDSI